MEHFILDGNNLMYKDRQLHSVLRTSIPHAQNALVRIINHYAGQHKKFRVTIVFDGLAEIEAPLAPNVFVKSSGSDQADNLIKEQVRICENPKLCTIVSSDMEVYNYARINGCKAVLCEEFLNDCVESAGIIEDQENAEKPLSVSKSEVKKMRKLFGDMAEDERKKDRRSHEEDKPREKKKSSKKIIREEIPDTELLRLKKHFKK